MSKYYVQNHPVKTGYLKNHGKGGCEEPALPGKKVMNL